MMLMQLKPLCKYGPRKKKIVIIKKNLTNGILWTDFSLMIVGLKKEYILQLKN